MLLLFSACPAGDFYLLSPTIQIREKEEDMKILEYIRAKDVREQQVAFEKERIRHEKEMETMRLRAVQVCCWSQIKSTDVSL